MVKLFVGGLPDGVDSIRLRQLFSQFVIVNECDVIKDYAFVHVAEESDARTAIEKLDGYILEGKPINIRRSTSKLRKEPGMDRRCFRCGAVDHKTPHCPKDPINSSFKRAAAGGGIIMGAPESKRMNSSSSPSYGSRSVESALGANGTSYGYGTTQIPNSSQQSSLNVDPDPELPRPLDSDLFTLYEQYIGSRAKYFYFRERLTKEVKARAQAVPTITMATLQAPYSSTNLYSAPPPATSLQHGVQQNVSTIYPAASTQHFYAMSSAPYASGAPSTIPQQQQQPTHQQPQLQTSAQPQVTRLY